MSEQPVLQTPRLVLRPFTTADASIVQRLAGAAEIADTTLNIPHPYEDGMAEEWIATHGPGWENQTLANYAITSPTEGVIGAVGLQITIKHRRAELGYWVGQSYWGQGYATEASGALLALGFTQLDLFRIQATHLVRNPSSGQVMQKLGMRAEGVRRGYFLKNGQFEDVASFAVLREDWLAASGR